MMLPIRALAPTAFCLLWIGAAVAGPAQSPWPEPRPQAWRAAAPVAGLVVRAPRDLGPRAGTPPPRRAFAPGRAEVACLARAVYHEARGEGEAGMRAVAEVVLNRVDNVRFPDSICGVVYQGRGQARGRGGCQFSFACDGSEAARLEPRAWARAQRIAREMVAGAPRALTGGATHFHTRAVRPDWSRVFPLTAEIGAHRFYRKPVRVAVN